MTGFRRILRIRLPEMRRRWVAAFFAIAAAALILWLAGLVWFVGEIPRESEPPDQPTEGIVVLTGGSLRLEVGFELLARGLGKKLLVSGVEKGVPFDDLLKLSQLTPDEMECCVTLGYMAGDTGGNATESAAWVRANKLASIRLVTSNYHMPRSLLEFRDALPKIEIVPHPVFPERVPVDDWWWRPGTGSLVVTEYNKYLLAAARNGLRSVFRN